MARRRSSTSGRRNSARTWAAGPRSTGWRRRVTNPLRAPDPGPYLHWVTITRPATTGGTTDPVTGKYVPASPETTLVDGSGAEPNADMQDTRKVLARDTAGLPTLTAEGQ